jgi:hypothetical protein
MAAARKADKVETAPEVEETGATDVAPVTPAGGDDTATADDTTAEAPATVDDAAPAESDAGAEEPVGYKVTGAAAVLRTVDGSERYLYRGATFPLGVFKEDSVEHAVAVGLVQSAE